MEKKISFFLNFPSNGCTNLWWKQMHFLSGGVHICFSLLDRGFMFSFPTFFRCHGNVGQFGRCRIQLFDVDTGRPFNRRMFTKSLRFFSNRACSWWKCTFQCHRPPSSNIIVCCNRLLTQFRIQKEQRINYVKKKRRNKKRGNALALALCCAAGDEKEYSVSS